MGLPWRRCSGQGSPEFHLLGHLCEYLRVEERRRGFAGLLGTLMRSFLSAWWPSCGCHCESRCTLKLGCLAASLSQCGDIGASSTSLTHVGPPWPVFHRTWMPGWPMFPGQGCQASKRQGSGKANLGVAAQLHSLFTFMHWRRKRQPTPVFFPGESQGWGSLVGCRLWGRTESDTTEAT